MKMSHLRSAYATQKGEKMGSELETGRVLTGHPILKYGITDFSLMKGCSFRRDEHKYSPQDEHFHKTVTDAEQSRSTRDKLRTERNMAAAAGGGHR